MTEKRHDDIANAFNQWPDDEFKVAFNAAFDAAGGIVDPVTKEDFVGPVSDPRAEQAPPPESMMLSGAGTVGSF